MKSASLPVSFITGVGFILAVWFFLTPQPALASSCIWTGFTDGGWFNSENWTGGCNYPLGVPGPLDDVSIPSTGVLHEPSIGGSVMVNSLNVSAGRTLSASGQLVVLNSFGNQGTVDVGGNTLDISGGTYYNSGRIIGNGTIRTYGPLDLHAGEVFSPTLELVSGTTGVNGVFSGSVVVDAGATFDQICYYPPGIVVKADLVVNGTITGGCGMWFLGEEITNNGIIKPGQFVFDTGPHTLTGAGKWQGFAVYVEYTSTLHLANDVTIEAGNLYIDYTSSLDLMGSTLTLSGTVAFDHRGFTGSNGLVRTQGNIEIWQSNPTLNSSFEAPLLVSEGTTTAYGRFDGPIEVSAGAVLTAACCSGGFTAYKDVTIEGSLTGYGALYFVGETFANQGSVSIHYVDFSRSGTQWITGNGQWTGDYVRIQPGSSTTLANDVTLTTSEFDVVGAGAELNLMGHVLTLKGDLRFDHRGFTGSNGSVHTEGTVTIYQMGTFNPLLKVVSGTTTVESGSQFNGPIEVEAGATLTTSHYSTVITAYGDATVKGSLTGVGGLYFVGETFVNEGSVSIHCFDFGRSGTQWITGNGQWTGDDVHIEPGSSTTLANDVILSTSHFYVVGAGAELDVASHTLTLEGDLRFDQRGRVKGSGRVRTQGSVLYSTLYGSQDPVLEVSQGTCSIEGYRGQLGSVQVSSDAQLVVKQGSNLDIAGDWISHGESQFESGTVITFNGGKIHLLSLEMATEFYTLKVGSGTTLVESFEPDNATVAGTLTNNGTIRKTKSVVGAGALTFGLTKVGMEIVQPGTLGTVRIDRTDSDAPAATVGVQTGRYWTVTPSVGATGYDLTMTLPHNFLSDPTVCRYEGERRWDCARATFTSTEVTRSAIAELSDWAVGNDIQPAAAPAVVMTTDGVDVAFAWAYQAADVEGYEVWYSLDPYFTPGDPDAIKVSLPQSQTTYTHAGAANDVEHNYAYLVLGVNGAGVQSGSAARTAEFSFGLVTGGP